MEFDLPGVKGENVDLDVERNVLTVKPERLIADAAGSQLVAAERPRACPAGS